jgi:hypothetical protein
MNLPPEFWYSLAAGVATLLISVAHTRGYRVPILENLLDVLHGRPVSPAPPPASPAVPTPLQVILDELRKRLPHPDDAKPASPQVLPQPDGNFLVKMPPH